MSSNTDPNAAFIRLPGLFRRFELERVVGVGVEFRIESAGCDCDGSEFFVVYRKESLGRLNEIVSPLSGGDEPLNRV